MIYKYIKYLYWNIYYFFIPESRDWNEFFLRIMRTKYPFANFKPFIYNNKHGGCWEIYLSDVADFSKVVNLSVLANVNMDDESEITGLRVPYKLPKETTNENS